MKVYADYVVEQFLSMVETSELSDVRDLRDNTDPLYIEFLVIPHFNTDYGLLAEHNIGSVENRNSALAYLDRIGEKERYMQLEEFIKLFKDLTSQAMWVFKSISGIGNAMKVGVANPYKGGDEAVLSFTCWESVDYRMQALLAMYKSIAYDSSRQVEILPANLRQFNLSIYTADVRILIDDENSRNQAEFGRTINTVDASIESRNHRMFHFGKCEFPIDSGSNMYEELSTTFEAPNEDTQFDLTYRVFKESSKFRTIFGDYAVTGEAKDIPVNHSDESDVSKIESIKSKLTQSRSTFLASIPSAVNNFMSRFSDIESKLMSQAETAAIAAADRIADNALASMRLRNVYNDSIRTIFSELDQFSVDDISSRLNSEIR